MPKRQQAAIARRIAHHTARIQSATTDLARLWKACEWLAAEARRTDTVVDVTRALLGLVVLLQKRLPLPEELYRTARTIEPVLGPASPAQPQREGGGAPAPELRTRLEHAPRRERAR